MKITKIVLAGAVALGVFQSWAAIRAVTPTAWNGDPSCWQMKRHLTKMESVKNGGAQVVFIGDSITHFWETTGVKTWDKYFANGKFRAINLGTSADRTEHVLWRLTKGGELDGYEAKAILLMIGTNNSGHFPFDKEPPIDTVFGIREILRVIAEKQPKARVILTSIFPRGVNSNDPYRLRNDVVNREIAKFADGRKVIWCDFSDKFLASDGRLSRTIFPDLLHPGPIGYEMWASAVLPILERIFSASEDEYIPSVWPSGPQGYPYGAGVPTTPMSRFGTVKWWDDGRLLDKRNSVVDGSGEYDLVLVGDSITHWWESKTKCGTQMDEKLTSRYKVLNLGISGDQTQHVLWRLQNGQLEGYTAKVFAVMIGTNNGGRDINSIAESIKQIVEVITKKHPESKVILMPIFPRGDKPDNKLRVANDKVNAIIAKIPDGKNVMWLDFNKKLMTADGVVEKDVMFDFLHLTEKGYGIWFDSMQGVLKDIIGR